MIHFLSPIFLRPFFDQAAGREEGRAPIRYVSLFSGIEAASCAWHPLGWEALAFAEIEPFPSAVLAHRWPGVPNLGDVTKANWSAYRGKADVLVGGPPCQAFSVAGLRESLNDDRGNMTLKFIEACDAVDPRYVVYENVPGILSTKDNAFGCFLGALVGADSALIPPRELGWTDAVVAGPRRVAAWRILDAQFFGVPQRRRRVFVVACPRDGADPAQILFECAGVQRNFETSRTAREEVAGTLGSSSPGGSGWRGDLETNGAYIPDVSPSLKARDYKGPSSDGDGDGAPLIAHSLRSEGFDASEDGTGRGTPLVPVAVDLQNVAPLGDKTGTLDTSRPGRGGGQAVLAFNTTQITSPENRCPPEPGDPCHPLAAGAHPPAVAFHCMQDTISGAVSPALSTGNQTGISTTAVLNASAVRRLTPRECERLMGLEDDFTLVPYNGKIASDGPRYRAIGNSMAVPCMAWLGRRIEAVERVLVSAEREQSSEVA